MHAPVLLKEILEIFNPRPGETYIDATVDGGGHAQAIAERVGLKGKVLGIDRDCEIVSKIENQISDRNIKLICGNYRDIAEIAGRNGFGGVNGILFDLGFSSYHIEQSGRGFSFQKDEPLDMRYNPEQGGLAAGEIVNRWPEVQLADVLRKFGEERFAGRIARGIAEARIKRKILSATALAEIIARAVPRAYRRGRLHPATRTFQALRIAVNRELEILAEALPQAALLLAPGGRIAVIAYHSLEDGIVKRFMREEKRAGVMRLWAQKPIRPSRTEIIQNPRSRSARLRAAIKI